MRSLSERGGSCCQGAVQKGRIAHLAERESERSEHLRTAPKCPRENGQLTCRTGDGIAADRLPYRPQNQLSRLGEIAAENHPARVQQVAEICDTTADMTADIGDHATAARVTVPRQPDDAFHGQIGAVAGLEERQDVARRRESLQAAPVAAAADGAGFIKSDVADFPRCATRAR